MGTITHLMRCPIVGGSELETLAITRVLNGWRHRVVFPARFEGRQPSLAAAFTRTAELCAVAEVEHELSTRPPEILHIQFPFLIQPRPRDLDSVLELRGLPPVPTLFTVHAAVNIPVVDGVHYLFHTERLAARFAGRVPAHRRSVCPSLVEPPADGPPPLGGRERPDRDGPITVLWVSRNEDGKFHPELPAMCAALLDADPRISLRFVGHPESWRLPECERIIVRPCPVAELDAEYRAADLFWYFPDPRLEETWCRTVTEAMARGLPCVVAAHGAMADQVVDGQCGCIAESPSACVAAILSLAADPDTRLAMASASLARAAGFFHAARTTLATLYRRLQAPAALDG